jgi:hypothetical protein
VGTTDAADRLLAHLGLTQDLDDLLLGERVRLHLNHPLSEAILTDQAVLIAGGMSQPYSPQLSPLNTFLGAHAEDPSLQQRNQCKQARPAVMEHSFV